MTTHPGPPFRAAVPLAVVLLLGGCGSDPAPGPGPAPVRPAPTATPKPDHSAFVAAADAIAADALERGPVAGLSIAVHARGTEVLARGYGFADAEAKVPATADTSYPIASVTKRLTAALLLKLAEQGRLSLDDPLSRFFPQARPVIGALTLRNLLQHTSGFSKPGPAPRGAAESVLVRGGTARPQGQDWTYSNYNFSLLGLVLEQVGGRDYATQVQQQVAGPLGLTGTGYCEDGRGVPGRTKDYLSSPRAFAATPYWAEARFFAGGGVCSTVKDLVRFEQALEGGTLVSAESARAMNAPARVASGVAVDYGLGTRLGYTGTHRKVGHTGGGQGNKAVVARYPDDDVTIVVLLNTERSGAPVTATDLEQRLARRFFGLPDAGGAPDAAAAARVAGEYVARGPRLRARADGGALVLSPAPARAGGSRFLPEGPSTFVSETDPTVELRFFEEGGVVAGFRRYRYGWFTGFAVHADRARAVEPGSEDDEDDPDGT